MINFNQKVADDDAALHRRNMELELSLSGFIIAREEWDRLDDDTRELFTAMLKEEGRSPRFTRRRPPTSASS